MKEPYSEGVAPHTDPESCIVGSNANGEALTGARTGQPLSGEIDMSGTPTLLSEAEGNMEGGAMREPPSGPAPSETLSTCGNSMRGNREVPGIPSADGGDGRSGKAGYHKPGMHILGKSDGCVVPKKLPNKGRGYRHEADRFLTALKARLDRFDLVLNPDKTRLIEFGRFAAEERRKRGEGKPETFDFLGFTHICAKTRFGKWFHIPIPTLAHPHPNVRFDAKHPR